MKIVQLRENDWQQVKEIYEEGIATGDATFETESPSWEKWNESHLPFARLIAQQENEILGWAALSKVSDRCVYGGVAEVSVYVKSSARGRGIGTLLLEALIKESEANNIWTLTAGIFPENVSSIHIHEKAGFRIFGRRERIGKMNGKWRDTLQLERRSKVVGVD
ncbi:MAG TPA: GNAT family N-acetyltransferase [Chitinophagales bacterium]|nr:GNAT family N-acetyltransferase [Chitinophagales bacterium]